MWTILHCPSAVSRVLPLSACDPRRLLLKGLSCTAVPVLRLPGREPAAPGVLHNTEFLFRASDWKSFKRLKNLMSLELSPCWNHSSGVTKQKKLFLYISQNFPPVTKIKSSLSHWKSQAVEGTAAYWFLQLALDNSPQARFCNISRIPHQLPRELTDPLKNWKPLSQAKLHRKWYKNL